MAEKKSNGKRVSVRHAVNAPCTQGFCVQAKPGKKSKTWWNGYRKPAPTAEAG